MLQTSPQPLPRRRSHADAAVVSQWLIDQLPAGARTLTSTARADRQRRLAPGRRTRRLAPRYVN